VFGASPRLDLEVLEPQRETLAQSKTDLIPRILAPTRYDNVLSWIHVNSRVNERKKSKSKTTRETTGALS
jgi:hypothetical protein